MSRRLKHLDSPKVAEDFSFSHTNLDYAALFNLFFVANKLRRLLACLWDIISLVGESSCSFSDSGCKSILTHLYNAGVGAAGIAAVRFVISTVEYMILAREFEFPNRGSLNCRSEEGAIVRSPCIITVVAKRR